MKKVFKKFDWWLFSFAFSLSLIGVFSLFFLEKDFSFSLFPKQLFFLFLGGVLAILFSFVDVEALKESSLFVFSLYFFGVLLLLGVFLFAPTIRGTRSWYVISGITFEPVEIVKIIFILFFAKYFSQRHVELYQAKHVILSAIYALLPVALVFFQPDFGSAMILLLLWLSLMLISGIKRKHLLILIGVFILAFFILWQFMLTEEQKSRFITFLEPYINPKGEYLDPQGTGYHILQSTIAIGSGKIFGKGPFEWKTQAKLGFLPEAKTDFIFASFCEMFGLLGVTFLFLLFFLLFWRLFKILKKTKNNFSRLLVCGVIILIGSETFINIGMNLGLLPITGLPLPFLSYGGSSLISLFLAIGMVESISKRL